MMRSISIVAALLFAGALQPAFAQPLPEGVTACNMTGWTTSRDPKGQEVRAEPEAKAKVAGRLAPAQKARLPQDTDEFPYDGLFRTFFNIVGHKPGWFMIENALHTYEDPGNVYLKRRGALGVKTYRGRGWIPADMVGGILSNHMRPDYWIMWKEPRAGAEKFQLKNDGGRPVGEGSSPDKVFACSGEWVQVQVRTGETGWWPGLCSDQSGACVAPPQR